MMNNKKYCGFRAIAELFSFRNIFLQIGILTTVLFSVSSHAAEVGSIPGSFEVSPSGAATYSIPIEVPPGINGLKPSLALVYNSQAGNGLLGQGWGLSGLSSVSRCPKTLAQDGKIHGVDFTNADRLCLDGQRLVPVNGASDDNGYWAAPEYRTEIESFSKVTNFGTWYQVETKDGRKAEYGNTPDSAQNVQIISSLSQPVLSWAVNKISDKSGNFIDYVYNEDVVNGEHRIGRIEYGSNNVQGTFIDYSIVFIYAPRVTNFYAYFAGAKSNILNKLTKITLDFNNNVIGSYSLEYMPITDDIDDLLLSNIIKCLEGVCVPNTIFEWINENHVYGYDEPASISLPNTYFSYNGTDLGTRLADINGDGLTDIIQQFLPGSTLYNNVAQHRVYLNTGSQYEYSTSYSSSLPNTYFSYNGKDLGTRLADIDGDGTTDIIQLFLPGSSLYNNVAQRRVYLSKNGRFEYSTSYSSSLPDTYFSYNGTDLGTRLADINGDGLTDIIQQFLPGSTLYNNVAQHRVYLNTGSQYEYSTSYSSSLPNTYFSYNGKDLGTRLADIDGDGTTDIIQLFLPGSSLYNNVAQRRVYLSKNGRFEYSTSYSSSLPNTYFSYNGTDLGTRLADINGDGLTDITQQFLPGSTLYNNVAQHRVYLNTGSQYEYSTSYSSSLPNTYFSYNGKDLGTRLADIDGDGTTDIIQLFLPGSSLYNNVAQRRVYLSKNGRFSYSSSYTSSLPNTYFSYNGTDLGTRLADLDGDGATDIIQMFLPGSSLYNNVAQRRIFNNQNTQYHVTNINDNYGFNANLKINSISVGAVYTKDATAQYPIMDYQGPIQVVSSVSTDNGIGSLNTTTYKYGGMKIHKRGRGSLGFRTFEVTDQQTGITNKTEFHQDYPYVGAVKHAESRLANGQLLSESDSYYTLNGTTCVNYPVVNWSLPECAVNQTPGIVYPYPDSTSSTQHDLNGVLIKTVDTSTTQSNFIDNFVGSTNSAVITTGPTGNVYKQVSINQYDNNASSVYSEKNQLTQSQAYAVDKGIQSATITKTFAYHTNGLLQTETTEPDSIYTLTKTYGYDGFGNRTSVTVSGADIASRTSATTYDVNGQFPETIKNAYGHIEYRVYDARFGVMTSRTGPNGLTTTYEYDGFGRQTAVQTATGSRTETTREWCVTNCVVPAITPTQTAQTVSYIVTTHKKGGAGMVEFVPPVKAYFDKFNREIRRESVGFDGSVIYADTNYNYLGQVAAQTLPYFAFESAATYATRFEYDLLGRVEHQYDPVGTHNEIIRNGLVTTYKTEVDRPYRVETRIETRNAIGQQASVQDNANQLMSFAYNAQGKRTTTTDPAGNVVTIGYDKLGRKTSMDDPDMGHWEYTYNALGELTSQKDAKNQITSMQYDLLGRMERRTDHDGLISSWVYNDNLNAGNTPRNKAIGKLEYSTSSNGYRNDLYYDNYGRPNYNVVNLSGTPYRTDTSYDEYSRIDTISYPESIGRFEVKHSYQNGLLHQVTSADGLTTYWRADVRTASGQVMDDYYNNDLLPISRTFDPVGRTTWLNVGDTVALYNAYYSYDSIGNLTKRTSQRNQGTGIELIEEYLYDDLNRLERVKSSYDPDLVMTYDGLGNIQSKTGVGAYTYYADRPHAVKTANGNTYNYDANGNLANGAGRIVTWSSHNKPINITNGQDTSKFSYGPDRKRFYQYAYSSISNKTTYYVNSLFERVDAGGVSEYKHYIRAEGQTIAVHTRKTGTANSTDYLLRDYQGSVVAVANEAGAIKASMDYDAFGARRSILGQSVIDQFIADLPRGYTGHEHLDKLGLIHMNGRVYDPQLGRFLSADPLVQAPTNLQSYNRYSYVMNNPMSYTDPSGYKSWTKRLRRLGNHISKAAGIVYSFSLRFNTLTWSAYTKPVREAFLRSKSLRAAGSVVAGVFDKLGCSGLCSGGYSAYLSDISGGSYEDIGRSGLTTTAITYLTLELNEAFGDPAGNQANAGLDKLNGNWEKFLKATDFSFNNIGNGFLTDYGKEYGKEKFIELATDAALAKLDSKFDLPMASILAGRISLPTAVENGVRDSLTIAIGKGIDNPLVTDLLGSVIAYGVADGIDGTIKPFDFTKHSNKVLKSYAKNYAIDRYKEDVVNYLYAGGAVY